MVRFVEKIQLPGREICVESVLECVKQTELIIVKDLYLKIIKFYREEGVVPKNMPIITNKSMIKQAKLPPQKLNMTIDT